jgi:hypothetical protein
MFWDASNRPAHYDPTTGQYVPVVTAEQVPIPIPGISIASGHYHYLTANSNTVTTFANVANQLRACAFIIATPTRISRLGCEVGGAGNVGSKVRLGIYRDNGYSLPSTLAIDAGTIDGASATVQEIAVDHTLTPGVYWSAVVCQGVTTTIPQVRGWISSSWLSTYAGNAIPAASLTPIGVYMNNVTGALPATFTTTGPMPYQSNGDGVPRMFAKGY